MGFSIRDQHVMPFSSVSFVKIGSGKDVLFLWEQMKLHEHMCHETMCRFESKERLNRKSVNYVSKSPWAILFAMCPVHVLCLRSDLPVNTW